MRLLKIADVTAQTSLSKATIYRLVHREQFPKPVRTAAAVSRWVEDEIDAWIGERVQERDTAA